jgi:hypothetical protein
LNNFNGVQEVLAAIESAAIFRLKKTREAMSNKHQRIYEELNKMISSDMNFKSLRLRIQNAIPPLVPFPGLFQKDLVFLETRYPNVLEGGVINVVKMEKLSGQVLELKNNQQTRYILEPVHEIQDYIKQFVSMNEDDAYGASLNCEPRV